MAEQLEELLNNPKKEDPTYKLIVMNSETFEEKYSSVLSVRSIYVLLSSALLILSILIVSFIVFTPIKKLIPGYAAPDNNIEYIQLHKTLDELENTVDTYQLYLNSFQTILTADLETLPIEKEPMQASNIPSTQAISSAAPAKAQASNQNLDLKEIALISPVVGVISAQFDPKKDHNGVDVLAPKNTPIKAIRAGNIIHAGWNMQTGNTIGVQHGDNVVSFYKHNSVLLKKEGEFVNAGEVIAIIGNTGTLSDGPHLHFELWQNGIPLNPQDYITFE